MSDLADFSQQFSKYHLGCGVIFLKDYLNIGYWTYLTDDTLYHNPNNAEGTVLYNHDLVKGIPAADNGLDVVYHSHFLEHLTNLEGIQFLNECYRVLKPGGIMRLVVPDLELWIQSYVNDNQFFFAEYRRLALGNNQDLYPTKAAIFMGMLHNHGHKMGYDFPSLQVLLTKAGFQRIRRTLFQESELVDIREIEPVFPLKIMESLYIECYKPSTW